MFAPTSGDSSTPPSSHSPPRPIGSLSCQQPAWDHQRCFLFEPCDDALRRATTNIRSFGTALVTHLRALLSLDAISIVERIHCTSCGGYCVELAPSIVPHLQPHSSVTLPDWGMWMCKPTTPLDLPLRPPSHGQSTQYRRDSFVVVGLPLSEDDTSLLEAFASANARMLGLSPTLLRAQLISAERLRRRCPSGPQTGQWQPSTSIRFVCAPSLVPRVLAAPTILLHFRAVAVRRYTLPTRQCYHCGMQGHLGRYCRGKCPFCDHAHPTQPCPLGQQIPSATPTSSPPQTPLHGTRHARGTH